MIVDGKTIQLDSRGYLVNLQQWTEALAKALASKDNIELTDAHWEVIYFLREFYQNHQTTPPMRALVKALKEKHGPEMGNSIYLHQLFPEGPAKQASKYAGLPKPKKCL